MIMDSPKYTEKCLNINDNEKFVKIADDPTKRIECKIQRCVRKIKNILGKQNTYICILLALHPEKFIELPKFMVPRHHITSQPAHYVNPT